MRARSTVPILMRSADLTAHLPAGGYNIRTIQELLGHKNVHTTMIDIHVLARGGKEVRSPADTLEYD